MSIEVSIKKQSLLGICFILIVLGGMEGISRIYEFIEPPNCILLKSDTFRGINEFLAREICSDMNQLIFEENGIIELKPNQTFKTISINSDGFRDDEINLKKSENEFRIFMVGGSTVFGAGASSNDNTIPNILEKKLNERQFNKEINVINAGIPFADSFRELYLIKNSIINYQPDIIIIYDGWNDAFHKRTVEEAILDNDGSKENIFDIKFKNFPYYRTPFVINNIFFEKSSEKITEQKNLEDNQRVIDNWKNNINEICKLGKIENYRTIIVIQPIIGVGNKNLTQYESNFLDHNTRIYDIINGFLEITPKLDKSCTSVNDITKIFDKVNEPIFTDQGHMSDFGNDIISDKLKEIIEEII